MKFLTLFVLTLFVNICIAQDDKVDFKESMNYDLFSKINAERVKAGLPELKYYFVMQNTLDQVAEGIKTNFCHCFGDTYETESLFQSGSVDLVISSLQKWKKKKSPLRRTDISKVTIGISDDEKSYYFVIRTFQ